MYCFSKVFARAQEQKPLVFSALGPPKAQNCTLTLQKKSSKQPFFLQQGEKSQNFPCLYIVYIISACSHSVCGKKSTEKPFFLGIGYKSQISRASTLCTLFWHFHTQCMAKRVQNSPFSWGQVKESKFPRLYIMHIIFACSLSVQGKKSAEQPFFLGLG